MASSHCNNDIILSSVDYEDDYEDIFEIELDQEPESSEYSSDSGHELIVDIEDVIPDDPFHPDIPLKNFPNDVDIPAHSENGWIRLETDDEQYAPVIPLTLQAGKLYMMQLGREPEDFFNALFDGSMWATIADETNRYASSRIRQLGAHVIEQLENPNYKKFSRLNDWKTVSEGDIKVFFAHLIIMGVVKKPVLESYWKKSGVCRTPFFGKFMS